MNRIEYLTALQSHLSMMPASESTRICDYYYEFISDAVDSGEQEEEVIAALGDPAALAYKLTTEQSFEAAKKNPGPSNMAKVLLGLLGILAFPIAFPVAIAVLAVAFALVVAIISIGVALLVALFASIFAALGLFAQAIAMIPSNPAVSVFMIGLSLLAAGIFLLGLIGLSAFGKKLLSWFLTICQKFIHWAFKKRGKAK